MTKIKRLNQQVNVKEWTYYLLENEYRGETFPLNSLSSALGKLVDANIYVVNTEGHLHGYYESYHVNTGRVDNMIRKKKLAYNYVKKLADIDETKVNIPIDNDLTIFPVEKRANYEKALTTIVPIEMSGSRFGTILIAKLYEPLTEVDLMVAEHASSLTGIELSFEETVREVINKNNQEKAQIALNALSKSEKRAVEGIFDAMEGESEMRLTTSEIADKIDITRSIVVNSLQKLVTASVIEQRSMGMKGTHIKIINPYFEELMTKE